MYDNKGMKKYFTVVIYLLLIFANAYPQRVGLVLSGGGAKGMAHLGVMQALEENNIPIDYVTGTSIGAIIGGMYAIGYSPMEILELFKSQEFSYWQTGEIQNNYVYSYKRKHPTPDIFLIKFSIKDSFIVQPRYFPTGAINPIQMNIAFMTLFSQATAASKGNFNNLFIPFRCIASDVYNKQAVVLKSGDLGDAVRASMTFPFVFRPIVIDSTLLFDGGIYDNFPTHTMKTDFDPDYIIGVSVSANPKKPNVRSLMSLMENMVMHHTDYTVDPNDGILIDFQLDNIRLLEFNKADELFKLGYDKAMQEIDKIKAQVERRISQEELNAQRTAFRTSFPELKFKNITVTGVNAEQQKYISRSFQENHEFITVEQFKKSYFKLMADSRIAEIRPHAVFNAKSQSFDLVLDVSLEDNFVFSVGGNVSSSVSSQAFFGFNYQLLKAVGLDFDLNLQFGQVYNAVQLTSTVDYPSPNFPFYLKLTGNIQGFNYYHDDRIFFESSSTISSTQNEKYTKFDIGFPVSIKSKIEMGTGYGFLIDNYFQSPLNFTNNHKDESRYSLFSTQIRYLINTLNDKQFPNKGTFCNITGQMVVGDEKFISGTDHTENMKKQTAWWQTSGKVERYCSITRNFALGIMGNAVWSERPLSNNYSASILQAPSFTPITHSKYTFNEAFSANQFIAVGIKPIYSITRQLSVRAEFYGFVPIRPIEKKSDTEFGYGKYFSNFEYIAETSLVFRFPFLSVSIFVNNYSEPARNWNAGFNIGYLIFNKKFLE